MPITFVRYCPTTGKIDTYGYTTDKNIEGNSQAKILKTVESSACELCPPETNEHRGLEVKVYTPILPDFSTTDGEKRWKPFKKAAIETATPAFKRKEG